MFKYVDIGNNSLTKSQIYINFILFKGFFYENKIKKHILMKIYNFNKKKQPTMVALIILNLNFLASS